MIPEFQFTEAILIDSRIIFEDAGPRKWKIADVLVRPCDLFPSAPEKSLFHVLAIPIHSSGTECPVRIVRTSPDKLVARAIEDGFVLYLTEDKKVWAYIEVPDCPELSLSA